MKQTNNAIKFLMAQYRAIFKQAYIKGLASAVILTAGLAVAGTANADNSVFDGTEAKGGTALGGNVITGVSEPEPSGKEWTQVTITSGEAFTIDEGTTFLISGEDKDTPSNNTITGTSAVKISGAGTLKVDTKDDTKGLSISAGAQGVTVDIGTIDVASGVLNVSGAAEQAVTMKAGNITLGQAASPTGRAASEKAVLSLDSTAGTVAAGSVTLGNADSTITINNNGILKLLSASGTDTGTTTITANTLTVAEGGLLSVGKGDNTIIDSEQYILEKDSFKIVQAGTTANENSVLTIKSPTSEISGNILVVGNDDPEDTDDTTAALTFAPKFLTDEGTAGTGTFDEETDTLGSVTFKSGSNVQIGTSGSMVLQHGTFTVEEGASIRAVADGAKITVDGADSTHVSGASSTLNISAAGLKDFLNAAGTAEVNKIDASTADAPTVATTATKANKGILELANGGILHFTDNSVDLGDFTFGSDASKINVNTSGKILAENLTVSKAISATGLTLEANDTLTVGSSEAASIALSVAGSAHNLAFKSNDVNDPSSLTAAVTLSAADSTDKNGSISGNFKIDSGGTLEINGGNYTSSGDITISSTASSGSNLNVKATTDLASSLTLTGDLTIDGQAADKSQILVSGAGTGDAVKLATLDITGVNDITVNEDKAATFEISGSGVLLATGEQINTLLNVTNDDTKGSTALHINGGKVLVDGDLGGTDGLDTTKFADTAAAGSITIAANGTLKAGSLSLSDSAADNALSLVAKDSNIEVDSLKLKADATTKRFDVNKGTLTVLKDITNQSNTDTLNLNATTLKDVTLNLGDLVDDKIVGGGNVGVDIKAKNAVIDVYGTWKAKDIIFDTAGTLTVNESSSLTVDEFTTSGSSSASISGSMTVNGFKNEGQNSGSGLTLVEGSVTLTGNMTLGSGVAEDISVTTSGETITVDADTIASGSFNIQGGELKIDFASGESFSAKELTALKKHLFNKEQIDGRLNIGAASIDGVALNEENKVDGRYDLNDVAAATDVTGGNSDVVNDIMTENAFYTDDASKIAGTVGAVHVTKGGTTVSIDKAAGFVNADKNGGFFVSAVDAGGNDVAADVSFSGSQLNLENGGTIGSVTLTNTEGELNIVSSDKVTNVKQVSGGSDTTVNIKGDTVVANGVKTGDLNVDKKLTVTKGGVTVVNLASSEDAAGSSVIADKLTVTGGTEFYGNLQISGNASFGGDTLLAGTSEFKDVSFAAGAELEGKLSAENLTVKDGTDTVDNVLNISNSALVSVTNDVTLGANVTLKVGSEAVADDTDTVDSAGYLDAAFLDLDGGTLIVDPNYNQAASVVTAGTLGSSSDTILTGYNGGTLNGKMVALRNSIIAVGFNDEDTEASRIEQVKKALAPLFDTDGSLKEKEIGAVVLFDEAVQVKGQSKIVVDAGKSFSGYDKADATYTAKISGNDVYIGANSALAVTDNALSSTNAAIHFDKNDASVYSDGGKVLLVGSGFNSRDTIKLFSDNGAGNDGTGTGVKLAADGKKLRIESLSGLFYQEYAAGSTIGDVKLELDKSKMNSAFSAASAPVKNSLMAYMTGDNNYAAEGEKDYKADILRGDVTSYKYDTINGYTDANGKPVTDTAVTDNLYPVLNDDKKTYTVYELAYNKFLDQVVLQDQSGASAEKAVRMAAFGGTAQAAIAAGSATYDAVAGRMGMGAAAGNITFADNGQGAGLWLAPVYKNHDSDGFGAQGVNYGVDMDLFGLALGGDFTLANGVRVGAALNVGSGDADGQGAGAGVSNDFDYVGFSVYGGYSVGQFSVVGDISYTTVDNDLSAATSVEKIKASADSSNLSVGVTGQYAFDFNGVSLAPHAGLRYSKIDMDDYRFSGETSGEIGSYKGDAVSVFSIPVGVTVSKDIVAGAWTVKPAFDFTLTANMGDDAAEGTVYWDGVSNMNTRVESEVIDSFTYGATLGVSAKTGNFGLGFGLSYTGSSNADELGVNANARFVF